MDALLKNWDKYEKMLSEYSKGNGSAMEEAAKSANNWEGALNRLSNTWTDTIGNIVKSDDVIKLINNLNELLSTVNSLTSVLGTWGSLALGAGIFAGAKNNGIFSVQNKELSLFGKSIKQIETDLVDFNETSKGGSITLGSLKNAISGTTVAAKAGSIALKGLAIASNMIAMAVIAKTVELTYKAYKDWFPTITEATNRLNEQNQTVKSASEEVKTLSNKLSEAESKLSDLKRLQGIGQLVDSGELNKLQTTTQELKTQLAIQKEQLRIEAQRAITEAKKASNAPVELKYDQFGNPNDSESAKNNNASPTEAMENAITAYKKFADEKKKADENIIFFQNEVDKLGDSPAGKTVQKELDNWIKKQSDLQTQMGLASAEANKYYNNINGLSSAYGLAEAAGLGLTYADQKNYEQLSAGVKKYEDYTLSVSNNTDSLNENSKAVQKKKEEDSKIDFSSAFSDLPTDKLEEYVSLLNSGKINESTISTYSDLNELIKESGISAEDAVKSIKEYADGFTSSTDLISNIQAAYDLLKATTEEYQKNGQIGLSSLESISNKYPELRSAVNSYVQGLISADDMMAQL